MCHQEAITGDNVTVKVNAVVYFRVIDPVMAIVQIEDYRRATWQIAQTSLRNVIGQSMMDQILQDREQINDTLQHIIDESTEPWGIKVSIVEIKDVELNSTMVRAMARQAEAERERRAKIIQAEGDFQSAQKLSEAARIMNSEPGAMTLRYLQTLVEIGVEQNTTTIFPIPIDIISEFLNVRRDSNDRKSAVDKLDATAGDTAVFINNSLWWGNRFKRFPHFWCFVHRRIHLSLFLVSLFFLVSCSLLNGPQQLVIPTRRAVRRLPALPNLVH